MAQALEHGRIEAHAESMLIRLVRDLEKGELNDSKSCFFIGLDVELARFYERQARLSEAQHYLMNRWRWYKTSLESTGAFDEKPLTLLEGFGREFERQRMWIEAEEPILWL